MMFLEYKNFNCYIQSEHKDKKEQLKDLFDIVDSRLTYTIKHTGKFKKPKVLISVSYLDAIAEVQDIKNLVDDGFTFIMILNKPFFDAYHDKKYKDCINTLVHEMMHCYAIDSGIRMKDHDDEELRVQAITKRIMDVEK